ncbi:diacylglycerol/lipid kinase family protein [Thalassoroseus pseudoceratinae]|uniref:diacylglycerol/lipid kinase family protein n=1 Tax=Thalassoroseus pseudoceratinae TaxID=2713176 RepID=UPI00141D855A|nr:diacylglycerol kinase family protein [Thalassoroseus pseudoceratinae]
MAQPWVAIQRNPRSGSGPRRKVLLELIARLKYHGLRPRLYSRREKLTERLEIERDQDDLVCIVGAGGDGTADDLINRFPGLPLAVLPLGTENLLAKYLKVPCSGKFVADMIAAGHTKHFDLATIGDRRFALMAGFGFDADIVHRLHAQRGGHITHLSYVRPIFDVFRRYSFPEMRFFIDDATTPLTASVAMIVNLPSYAMRLPLAADADGHDGLLDIRLFRPKSRRQLVSMFLSVVRCRHEKRDDVECIRATSVRIECDEPIPAQVDGDPAGLAPAEVRVLPSALKAFVPA